MRSVLCVLACAAWLVGCVFDRSGLQATSFDDQGAPTDLAANDLASGDGLRDGRAFSDLDLNGLESASPAGQRVRCPGLTCPLGCNVAADRCYRVKPTGFDANAIFSGAPASLTAPAQGTITINSDSGRIVAGSSELRPQGSPGTF